MRGNARRRGKYRSGFEKEVGQQLGRKAKHESEKLEYEVPARKRKYIPDFVLEWSDHKRYIEVKGIFTAADRKKILNVIRSNPGIDLRIVFQENRKLTKAKKGKRYTEWCEKHGILCAVGEVPKSWRRKNG